MRKSAPHSTLRDFIKPHATTLSIPIVDISPYVTHASTTACQGTAVELRRALQAVGFVQIRGHGITDTVLDGLKAAMDAFFAQTLDFKQAYRASPTINRGYTPPR